MQPVDTLISAPWIVPVEPEEVVLNDHAIVVDGGTILDVIPLEKALQRYSANEHINLSSHVLIPGLINAHTHAAMSLMRGLADDLPLMTWLNEHIWPAESKLMSAEFVRDGTNAAIAEMLRGGTTCFNDMYFFPDEVARAARSVGIRAQVGLIVIDFPSAWASNANEYIEKGLTLHDELRDDLLITTCFAPHAPYTVGKDTLLRIKKFADQLELGVHIHLHETSNEIIDFQSRHDMRPLAYLEGLGMLNPGLMAVHLTQLNESEIERLACHSVSAIHCPESNLKLASGMCPVEQLDKAGINVAIGTDGAASNNDLDMFGEMRTAALLAKGVSGDASAVPAARALSMATINGARALGIENITGSILPGKQADIVAVDLDALETQPLYHPLSQLVYTCGRHQVSDVWVAGRRLLDNRRLTTSNVADIESKTAHWQQLISRF